MTDEYNDAEAAAHYADPSNRSIAGKNPRRRTARGLSAHVPREDGPPDSGAPSPPRSSRQNNRQRLDPPGM